MGRDDETYGSQRNYRKDGSGTIRPITCRYGLSRGSGGSELLSSPSSKSSSPAASETSRGTLSPWDYIPAEIAPTFPPIKNSRSSDIVLAAENRHTRKISTGRALNEANRVLGETFTIDRGQSLASLTPEHDRLPRVSVESSCIDFSEPTMRRRPGDRKMRMTRTPNTEGMMVLGRGYRTLHEDEKKEPGTDYTSQTETSAALSEANKERQRIRATMASMKHEIMGVGAKGEDSPGAEQRRSSTLLEEAASSRSARIRRSREIAVMGEVKPTTDTSWKARTLVGDECDKQSSVLIVSRSKPASVPGPVSQEPAVQQGLFQKLDRTQSERTAASAISGRPVTQSAVGFDKWSVRRSSIVVSDGSQETVVPTAPVCRPPQFDDLEIEDDENLGEMTGDFGGGGGVSLGRSAVKGNPIDEQVASRLKELMFGSPLMSFSPEWTQQNLGFNTTENITYGIVQHKGGPCGVLAVVQAYLVKMLLFGSQPCGVGPAADPHTPTPAEQRAALAASIAEILWKCGHGSATVALSSGRSQFPGGGRYKSDGITETLQLQTFTSGPALLAYVQEQLSLLMSPTGAGCVLLTYSAILSRGIDEIKQDMDLPTNTVIGQHGYCTQELVNLLLTGTASSNVFNGTMQLGEGKDVTVLRGIQAKSEIGILSLFEHYKSCEVGSHLKSPLLPIWVILSESHFTCIFSNDRQLCQEPPAAGTFDLYYYDMLARQDDQIRLTVEYGGNPNAAPPPVKEGELVPPLEHCLRTRWPGAKVSWNGYEAIL